MPTLFKTLLLREVYNLRNLALHLGLIPSVRPNGASDYAWEHKFPELFTAPGSDGVVFYDYSKIAARVLSPNLPANYHLTFSRNEKNERECFRVLHHGRNVAIVFADLAKAIRTGWKANGRVYTVIDGDETDARPTDSRGAFHGHVVGLSIKGNVTDDTGFFIYN